MAPKSGTIIATGLKRLARLSGSSDLPAYPGFIVMKRPVSLSTLMLSSPNGVLVSFFRIASRIIWTYCATTESTSTSIRLNSSKQPHDPESARPAKIFPRVLLSIQSEQFEITTQKAKFLPKSLTVSVLPVPAGPCGAPPLCMLSAFVRVMYALSVNWVTTSLPLLP